MQESKMMQTVLFAVGGVLVLLIALFTFLEITKPDYSDFEHLGSYQQILSQEEDSYLVYWYGENCSHCKQIKDKVLQFAAKTDHSVYLIESGSATGVPNLVHPTDPNMTMSGTPTLIVIVDGKVADMVSGSDDVPSLIDDINSGNYVVLD